LALVSKYGLEKARGVVDFAAAEAAKTKFSPQNFGAVLNYTSRAVADFDRRQQKERAHSAPAAAHVARQEPEEKRWPRGEARLAVLTPEQYRWRFEKTKAILFAEVPFLAQQRSNSDLQEKMVRSRMVRALEREPMDILPPSALKLPESLRGILPVAATQNPGMGL
jgi:hypothetical protein